MLHQTALEAVVIRDIMLSCPGLMKCRLKLARPMDGDPRMTRVMDRCPWRHRLLDGHRVLLKGVVLRWAVVVLITVVLKEAGLMSYRPRWGRLMDGDPRMNRMTGPLRRNRLMNGVRSPATLRAGQF